MEIRRKRNNDGLGRTKIAPKGEHGGGEMEAEPGSEAESPNTVRRAQPPRAPGQIKACF
jgi:hypothetical protein